MSIYESLDIVTLENYRRYTEKKNGNAKSLFSPLSTLVPTCNYKTKYMLKNV